MKAQKGADPIVDNQLLLVIITILLPPLGVYLHEGEINTRFWISLLLTLLFYIPGLIYSLIVVLGA
ncbi:YqaE/Pmp3 family membrane protein [Paracnuella aquatica]|nr:YqaE/Pmp3 family membrane protein [Paracnuella aquatica]